MKHDTRVWLFTAAVAVVLSAGGTRAALADCEGVARVGHAWVVSPSGTDDTARIQCALDEARAAGRGRTVWLKPGTFHVGLVRVQGFDGYFKGAGMNATRITPLLALDCPAELAEGRWPVLVAFDAGYPRISDMTFEMTIDQMDPCLPYTAPWDPVPQTGLGALLVVGGGPIAEADADRCETLEPVKGNATIEHVGFRGPYPSTTEAQAAQMARRYVEHAVNIGGWGNYGSTYCTDYVRRVTGKFAVTNSSFQDINSAGVGAQGLLHATVKVGGSPRMGNFFKDVGFSFLSFDAANSMMEASYNHSDTQCLMGMYAVQSAPWIHLADADSTFLVHHNDLRVSGGADAVYLEDWGPVLGIPPTLKGIVAYNKITLADTGYGGIGTFSAQNALIYGNKISGNGMAGIYAGIWGDGISGWKILRNDVEGVNSPPAVAPIWLGAGTSRNLVVGGRHPTGVLDEGTDNLLIHVDRIEPAP